MPVHYTQLVDGEESHSGIIAPHYEGQTDRELLLAKFRGADDKDWDTGWLSETSFVARKVRWQNDNLCERVFWIEG